MNILKVPAEAIETVLNDGDRDVPVVLRFGRHSVDMTVEQPGHYLQISLHIVRGRAQLVTRKYGGDNQAKRPVVTELFRLPPESRNPDDHLPDAEPTP